jgi:hypothetical protein
MSKMVRTALITLAAAGVVTMAQPMVASAAPTAPTAATAAAAAVATPGYPSPATVGFHHLGLVYDNAQRTTADLNAWVAQHRAGVPVANRWLFDAYLMLDLYAPSGASTDVGVTTAADWTALLNRWFGTTAGGGTIGRLDAAITRVSATRSTAGTLMGQPPTRRKIVVSMPWPADTQANFGTVDGRPADLRIAAERDRVSAWYIDQVRQRFAAAGYRNVDLWGVYLMREDILPADEGWATRTTAAAHARGLKVAWIPYFDGVGWDRWRSFGLDVAIMQPSYGFRSPVDGGQVDANRLAVTAQQAQAAGLGIEIEARGSSAGAYHTAMFRQYLSEGVRLGYREASTAYFLGWSRTPVIGEDAGTALGDYIAGSSPRSSDVESNWSWTGTTTTTATTAFTARSDLTSVRLQFAAGPTWRGTVTVSQQFGGVWQASGTTHAGATPFAGTQQSVIVPLATRASVTGLRVTFTPAAGVPAPSVQRIVLDSVWPTGTGSVTTGAPYTVSTNGLTVGQFADTAGTVGGLGRGLLTDGAFSSSGWWNARPVGWWETSPVRVLFDLGSARSVDRVVLHTHDSPDASVNWPMNPQVLLSATCPVLNATQRGTTGDCRTTPLTGVTTITGTQGRSLDGAITFASPTPVTARYATLLAQPTGWFLADEVRFYSGTTDVTSSVSYRLLTAPNPQSSDTSTYLDNGVRLTDGNVAPIMSGPAVTGWHPSTAVGVTVDLARSTSVRYATAWFVDDNSYGVVRPRSVTVETSADGLQWSALGTSTAASNVWNSSVSYSVAGTARQARYIRTTVAADTAMANAWYMLSEVEATG